MTINNKEELLSNLESSFAVILNSGPGPARDAIAFFTWLIEDISSLDNLHFSSNLDTNLFNIQTWINPIETFDQYDLQALFNELLCLRGNLVGGLSSVEWDALVDRFVDWRDNDQERQDEIYFDESIAGDEMDDHMGYVSDSSNDNEPRSILSLVTDHDYDSEYTMDTNQNPITAIEEDETIASTPSGNLTTTESEGALIDSSLNELQLCSTMLAGILMDLHYLEDLINNHPMSF